MLLAFTSENSSDFSLFYFLSPPIFDLWNSSYINVRVFIYIHKKYMCIICFPNGSAVKNPPVVQEIWETQFQFLGGEDIPWSRKQQPTQVFAWRIPWTEDPGRLQSMELQSWTQLSKHIVYISHIYIYITSICIHIEHIHVYITVLLKNSITSNQFLPWLNTTPPGAGSLLPLLLIHCCCFFFFNFYFTFSYSWFCEDKWRIKKHGMLQFRESQRVGRDLGTKQQK